MISPLRRLRDISDDDFECKAPQETPEPPCLGLMPGLGRVREVVEPAIEPIEPIEPQKLNEPAIRPLTASLTPTLARFIEVARKMHALPGAPGVIDAAFVESLSDAPGVSQEEIDLLTFPKDAPCVRYKDIDINPVEWECLKHAQTLFCEIHGVARQVTLSTCSWHKEEGDPACAAAECRHASDASRRALAELEPETRAQYEWRHAKRAAELKPEQIIQDSTQETQPSAPAPSFGALESLTPDGKIRKGSKYKRKSKVGPGQMTMF